MSSKDRRLHIIYNGEIYNYIELREELRSLGSTFGSTSDTEVLLEAWRLWGEKSLRRFEGMFAFVLLDLAEKKVYLARDYFGIKPLHYCDWSGGIAVGSEFRTLSTLPGVNKALDPQVSYDYLTRGVTEHTDRTFFAGIRQVRAAHLVVIDVDTSRVVRDERYWRLRPKENRDISFHEAAGRLRDLFVRNVERHLRSDVAVGAALSGGIDSSSIVCAIRTINPKIELHTFSYVADDEKVSEERWIDLVAAHARATPHKVKPSSRDLEVDLPQLMQAQNVPFGSTSIYAQYKVFELAKQAGIKVMLDGQGADEILAGYFGYRANALIGLLAGVQLHGALTLIRAIRRSYPQVANGVLARAMSALVPALARPALRAMVGKELTPRWLSRAWLRENDVLTDPASSYRWRRDSLRESLISSVEIGSLPHLLRYEDRNSMSHSIESRVPFLTPELVTFVLSLPPNYIIDERGMTKSVFREAMRPLVPKEVLARTDKIGFSTPEEKWLTEERAEWVHSALMTEGLPALFDRGGLIEEWDAIQRGARAYGTHVWRWLNLIEWAKQPH